jgi:hypothetical protein
VLQVCILRVTLHARFNERNRAVHASSRCLPELLYLAHRVRQFSFQSRSINFWFLRRCLRHSILEAASLHDGVNRSEPINHRTTLSKPPNKNFNLLKSGLKKHELVWNGGAALEYGSTTSVDALSQHTAHGVLNQNPVETITAACTEYLAEHEMRL